MSEVDLADIEIFTTINVCILTMILKLTDRNQESMGEG